MKPSISVENIYTISGSNELYDPVTIDADREITVILVVLSGILQYYRQHGDYQGLDRLRWFRSIAIPLISEYCLNSPIVIDDAIWGCFTDQEKAYQCAFNLFEFIKNFKPQNQSETGIKIKILIHYGEALREEQRLYGTAVQFMRDIISYLPDNSLYCTETVIARNKPSYDLEKFNLPYHNSLHQPLIYQILTNRKTKKKDTDRGFLWVKLLPKYQDFLTAWENFLYQTPSDQMGQQEVKILSDTESLLLVSDVSNAAELAVHRLPLLFKSLPSSLTYPLLPLQILIGTFTDNSSIESLIETIHLNIADIEPGAVTITSAAYRSISKTTEYNLVPPYDEQSNRFCYRITLTTPDQADEFTLKLKTLFFYGNFPICFYCNRKDHPAVECPSKMIDSIDRLAIDKLGYMSLYDIKRMLINALAADTADNQDKDPGIDLGDQAIYELMDIFQLRCIRTVWETEHGIWENVFIGSKKSYGGGELWLAMDCLRSSNLTRAESILNDCLKQTPYNYQVYMLLGLVFAEKQDYPKAGDYFYQSLHYSATSPQRILCLMLYYRSHLLAGNILKAEKALREALQQDKNNHDAIYLMIKNQLANGRLGSEILQLKELIRADRRYFIRALIDPELFADDSLAVELQSHYQSAKTQAEEFSQKARQQMSKLETLFGARQNVIYEFQSMFALVEKYQTSNSYFGYLDAIRFCDIIITRGKRVIEEQKQLMTHILNKINRQCSLYLSFLNKYPYHNLTKDIERNIAVISAKAESLENAVLFEQPAGFGHGIEESNALLEDTLKLESKIRTLTAIIEIRQFLLAYGKLCFIIQVINGIVSFLLFPLITYIIVVVFLQLQMESVYKELSPYIGGLFAIAGVFGALLAAVMTANKLYPE